MVEALQLGQQVRKERIARHIERCDICRLEKGAKSEKKMRSASYRGAR